MNTHSFTYIIGYRHSPDRLNNLRRVLDWINGFANVEVILVEQDKHSKISHLSLKCKHIFIKTDKPYNKSWGYNVGLKSSNTNIVIFGDADTILDPNKLIESIQSLDKYEMVSPHNSIVDLFPNEANLQYEDILKISRPGKETSLCSGISVFRKDAIQKIGGWNESFIGLGGADEFLSHKVKNFLTSNVLPISAYHFFHNKIDTNPVNEKILQQMVGISKEDLVRSVNMSAQKTGMRNFYDTF